MPCARRLVAASKTCGVKVTISQRLSGEVDLPLADFETAEFAGTAES